jgi:hypothetical protein
MSDYFVYFDIMFAGKLKDDEAGIKVYFSSA